MRADPPTAKQGRWLKPHQWCERCAGLDLTSPQAAARTHSTNSGKVDQGRLDSLTAAMPADRNRPKSSIQTSLVRATLLTPELVTNAAWFLGRDTAILCRGAAMRTDSGRSDPHSDRQARLRNRQRSSADDFGVVEPVRPFEVVTQHGQCIGPPK